MRYCLLITLIAIGLFPFAGCSSSARDTSMLKEELKREILAELRQQEQTPSQVSSRIDQQQLREQMKVEIEHEVMAKIQAHAIAGNIADTNNQSVQWQAVPVGSAQGQILRDGKGLAGCKVKLLRILRPQSVIEMFNTIREGAEFTTVTNEQGKYVFGKLPIGAYKLKWQLPNDTGWIRRLRDKPDAVITKGQNTVLKPVETKRRLVSN